MTAPDMIRPQILVFSYHKSGTTLFDRVMHKLAEHLGLSIRVPSVLRGRDVAVAKVDSHRSLRFREVPCLAGSSRAHARGNERRTRACPVQPARRSDEATQNSLAASLPSSTPALR